MADIGPCYFVIFGATGNLATRKLLPALYQLEAAAKLHADLRFIALARREWSREQWLDHLRDSLNEHLDQCCEAKTFARFADRFDYVAGDLNDPKTYRRLMDELSKPRPGVCENIVFYLAIKPSDFLAVVEQLNGIGINRAHGRHRVVVEKPFGEDIDSARALNAQLHRYFDEDQVFRIDHYLGKETVQNLLVFRFANTLIEPIWNRNYIDHVQITVAEAEGVGGRAGYYDGAGALRDMLQNHLMQLLTLVAMEPPATIDADALRDEKVKVLRSIRPIAPQAVHGQAFRAQYGSGRVHGKPVIAYREEGGVADGSVTETYAAAKFFIDNWRWRGVPFYLRTGKRLADNFSLIAIRFRHPPQLLFHETGAAHLDPNWVVLSLQPTECMHIELHAKEPGLGMNTRIVKLNASYRETEATTMEAYKTLLLDVVEGDRSLFIRFDEVEWAWRVVDPILRDWAQNRDSIVSYAAGGWGPREANRLFERDDQYWRNEI
ncbi:MAG: glucose-6-phosphate dehydrogenase [Pseudomonadota bacterium]|nr:MAG: glucose-6-phosphate dehydrogenase [Pseudomonadota bacterium]